MSPVDAGVGSDFRAPFYLMRPAPESLPQAQRTAQEGLGKLPSYIPSVTALLLFNTSDNPYKTYVERDNLSGDVFVTSRDRRNADARPSTGLAAAPNSVRKVRAASFCRVPPSNQMPCPSLSSP